jgi:hypothetical protein
MFCLLPQPYSSLTISTKYVGLWTLRVGKVTYNNNQLIITQEIARCGARGYGDGLSQCAHLLQAD